MSRRWHSRSARLAAAAMTMVMSIVAPAAAGTAEAQVPAEKQALIMLRILAYDHALAGRAGTAVRLAVVHGRSAAALQCAGRMRSALDDLVKRVAVTGKPLEVETVPLAEVSGAALARRRLAVLYVCAGSDAELPSVVQAARAAHVLTFTDEVAYLARGLSIALSEDGPRVGISINLVAARAEGARLNGQLLQRSKVVAR